MSDAVTMFERYASDPEVTRSLTAVIDVSRRTCRRAIHTTSRYVFVASMASTDGSRLAGLPFRDSSGQLLRWYVLLTDIDDLKRGEEELRRVGEDVD